MAKTEATLQLERQIWEATHKIGVFCCYEVTIGFGKRHPERVDYLTYDTKGTWRCYEIKSSKSDFNSKAKITFVGHYNYYVMTPELFNEVQEEIPSHVGVYVGGTLKKRPKRQELGVEENVLIDSMIRSLYRETEKVIRSEMPSEVQRLTKAYNRAKSDSDYYRRKYNELLKKGTAKLGRNWHND